MDILHEINEEIVYYLRLSSQPGLEGRLQEIAQEKREALYNMIAQLQYQHAQKTIIAFQVKEDVLALLEGREVEFSRDFLEDVG